MIGFLHYSAPPVVGGVESLLAAHAEVFIGAGYPVTVIAGDGDRAALPDQVNFVKLPLLNSRHPRILKASEALDAGAVPADFEPLVDQIVRDLRPRVSDLQALVIHNVLTKHFNLPLTAALHRLLDEGAIACGIGWCHDLSYASPNSRARLHPGQPWELLRSFRPDLTYVAVSERQARALAELFGRPLADIHVVYNGVNPARLLGLSEEGESLAGRLGLFESALTILMPVRITRAKNVEYALRLMAELKQRIEGPRLIMTGPPDPHDPKNMAYFNQLRQLRQELRLDQEFHFVYESGPDANEPLIIGEQVVGDLYRLSDLLFMPSHREGFGMPVLEAGLMGLPVICTDIPAAAEIGRTDVLIFKPGEPPRELSERILQILGENAFCRLRRRVRREYTWKAIFQRDIAPLLESRAQAK
jgi:glycosyltransferase involved in cell wall biosynthesis